MAFPRYVTVLARTADDHRCVVRNDDPELAAAMVVSEWCGREIAVDGGNFSARD